MRSDPWKILLWLVVAIVIVLAIVGFFMKDWLPYWITLIVIFILAVFIGQALYKISAIGETADWLFKPLYKILDDIFLPFSFIAGKVKNHTVRRR